MASYYFIVYFIKITAIVLGLHMASYYFIVYFIIIFLYLSYQYQYGTYNRKCMSERAEIQKITGDTDK